MTLTPSEILTDSTKPAIVTDPQTGRQFVSSYRYQRQFDNEFDIASNRMIHQYGAATERFAWAYIFVFGILMWVGGQGLIRWGVQWLISDPIVAKWLTWMIVTSLWVTFALMFVWALRGRTRFRRRLIEQRLCFNCGYALVGQTLDQAGQGRCPECGHCFDVRRYLRPPKRYHRVAPN